MTALKKYIEGRLPLSDILYSNFCAYIRQENQFYNLNADDNLAAKAIFSAVEKLLADIAHNGV